MKDPVKDRLKRYALYERFGDDHFLPDGRGGGERLPRRDGVTWTDWEDRAEVNPEPSLPPSPMA